MAKPPLMKLVLLIPTLDRSGAEKQLTRLACGLPKDEFDVHVVGLTRGGPYEAELRDAGVPVTILGKRLKFDPGAIWRLRRFLHTHRPDILHTWLFAANAYGRMVAGRGPKVIVSERCVDVWKSGWQTWLDARLISRTHRLVANSESVAAHYREHGVPSDRILVIPNGVDIPPPRTAEVDASTAALREELGIAPHTRVVGYVGRLAKQKRVNDLVWGLQLLRQATENVCFVIVGDGPERKELERLAVQFGCTQFLRFVGHRNDASRFFPMFQVFWLGSDFEGMSNSLMEAMAHGIPVVASDIPPNRELVVDGQTGFVVKAGDSFGFAQFTDRLLADTELACRLGEAGRARMQTEFSMDRMIERHIALYRSIRSA
ncbi:MAG: glycosyltransferase [Planctomycetaceae bacterium]|nr:glycosyltransferase [Planctomycetaceae bacterium]